MKVVGLSTIVKDRILAATFEGQISNELSRLMNIWTDVEYLKGFFDERIAAEAMSFFNILSAEIAAEDMREEPFDFEDILLNSGAIEDLSDLFRPLHSKSTDVRREASKAYGPRRKSWLRIYAIRITHNCFVISGEE